MTGALGLLGAPRQRSASNLSVARQARPSGSVMKITLLSLSSPLGLRLRTSRTPPCPRTRSVYGRVALLAVFGRVDGQTDGQTGRQASTLSVRDGLPLSDRLEDRRRVAHNEKAAKVNLAGPWFWLVVDVECRRRCRRGVRFGSCVPTHRSHPSPLASGPAAPTPRATLLPCAVVLVLIRQIWCWCTCSCSHCTKYTTAHRVREHRVPILPHPTNNKSPPLPSCPRAQPHSGNTPNLIACWFGQRPAPADNAIGLRWIATRSNTSTL